jgi:hypothetical protein
MRPDSRPGSRRVTAVRCSPLLVIFAVVVIAGLYLAVPVTVTHRGAVMASLRDIGAVLLSLAAAGMLLLMARRVAAYHGTHTDVLPGDEPEIRTRPRPRVRPRSEPEPEPAREPAEPVVPGYHPGYTLRPADRAVMEADADAFADDSTGVVVSDDGDIYELARPAGEDEW